MPTPQELESRFWKKLGKDMTMMLGLVGIDDGHTRPMTAQFEEDRSPIWFFTSSDNARVEALGEGGGNRAIATFASKDHDIFAAVHGTVSVDTDRAVVERLWNPFVAAWYEEGKDDPKLRLLRLDAEQAEIWENGNSLVAGAKMLFGVDPKQDYQDKVAEVSLA